jgi:hemerythrin
MVEANAAISTFHSTSSQNGHRLAPAKSKYPAWKVLTMSLVFQWEDQYSIDQGPIDADHKHLFELANRIALMAESQIDFGELKSTTQELYRYMEEHFSREESLMREARYTDYDDHVAAHETIIRDMNLLLRQSHSVDHLVRGLSHAMVDWVVQHILDKDKQLIYCVPIGAAKSTDPFDMLEIDWD